MENGFGLTGYLAREHRSASRCGPIRVIKPIRDISVMNLGSSEVNIRESVQQIGAVIALALHGPISIEWRNARIFPETKAEAVR